MNKQQFIKQFNLEKIEDDQLISYMKDIGIESNIISLMKKTPIEIYKHSFDRGTVLYVSFNTVINKIIAEFYFVEDSMVVSIFEFIIKYLDEKFNVKNIFTFKNCESFIEYYNNICLDYYNEGLIDKELLNDFMKKFNDVYFKNIISFGFDVIKNISLIKGNDFLDSSNNNYFTF